jgi:hypothetical protein
MWVLVHVISVSAPGLMLKKKATHASGGSFIRFLDSLLLPSTSRNFSRLPMWRFSLSLENPSSGGSNLSEIAALLMQ